MDSAVRMDKKKYTSWAALERYSHINQRINPAGVPVLQVLNAHNEESSDVEKTGTTTEKGMPFKGLEEPHVPGFRPMFTPRPAQPG